MAPWSHVHALSSALAASLLLAPSTGAAAPSSAGSFRGIAGVEAVRPMSATPFVAASWSVDFVSMHFPAFIKVTGKLWYDGNGERHRWLHRIVGDFQGPSDPPLIWDVLEANVEGFNHNITAGEGSNAVCHRDRRPRYVSLFDGLLTNGRWGGRRTVRGEPCDVWHFISADGAANASACLGKDGVPRLYNTTLSTIFAVQQGAFPGTIMFEFGNISIGHISSDVLDASDACAHHSPQPLCEDQGVVELSLYRFHGRGEPRQLDSKNIGDALGDMVFACSRNPGNLAPGRVITHWAVRANSSFGQYSYCFFLDGENMCMTDSKVVGRESALGAGAGAVQGQCTENRDVGSWYMLPAAGECRRGARVGDDGCTWEARVVRTIDASCVLDRGMREACERERGSHPFRRPVEILTAALATSDAALGGCPDADLPPAGDDGSEVVIV